MDRNLIIKKCYGKIRKLSASIKSNNKLSDVNKLLAAEKEIEIQKCHLQYQDICTKRSLNE